MALSRIIDSRYCFRATSLFSCSSFELYRNVTMPACTSPKIFSTSSGLVYNSAAYRPLNSVHLLGSCPYQRRSSVEGSISFNRASTFALSLEIPRGHNRSTRIRRPSDSAGSSHTLLTRILIRLSFIDQPYNDLCNPPPNPERSGGLAVGVHAMVRHLQFHIFGGLRFANPPYACFFSQRPMRE